MTFFKTETGSVYELDQEGKRFRRLEGVADPTERTGKDGEWKSFEGVSEPIQIGKPVVIVWKFEFDPADHPGEMIARSTITSCAIAFGPTPEHLFG